MSLDKVLKKAVERIQSSSLENEAQVKQAVILPILRALDWDDSDPAEFVPEFSAGNGRVDYALLRSGGGPLVFIEAKGLGGVDAKGEEQVFRYAVNRGVPFLILTDGNLWDFYLSMAAGDPPRSAILSCGIDERGEDFRIRRIFRETSFEKSRRFRGCSH